jgi:hypothetical protein
MRSASRHSGVTCFTFLYEPYRHERPRFLPTRLSSCTLAFNSGLHHAVRHVSAACLYSCTPLGRKRPAGVNIRNWTDDHALYCRTIYRAACLRAVVRSLRTASHPVVGVAAVCTCQCSGGIRTVTGSTRIGPRRPGARRMFGPRARQGDRSRQFWIDESDPAALPPRASQWRLQPPLPR